MMIVVLGVTPFDKLRFLRLFLDGLFDRAREVKYFLGWWDRTLVLYTEFFW